MKHPGPLLTLAAGVVLAGALATLNAVSTPKAGNAVATAAVVPSGSTAVTGAPQAGSGGRGGTSSGGTAAPTTPAPAPGGPPLDYAGWVTGHVAALGISVQGDRAIAYLCNGHQLEAWLQGTVGADGALNLTGSGGARLTGGQTGGHATGTITATGTNWTFDITQAAKPAGIYRATGAAAGKKIRAGWVVQGDGGQTGIVDRADTPGDAPVIDPATGAVTIDGTALSATPLTAAAGL